MTPGAIEKTLEKTLRKRKDVVTARIEAYIKNPDDGDAIHDVRTSLRRLEATFSILPKKTRHANEKYLKNCKNFFRANSKIRDFDIIRERAGTQLGAGAATLLHELETGRKSELGRARRLAVLLTDAPQIRRMHLSNAKVMDRADKVASRHLKGIQKLLPVVLSDERQIEDLHKLRKKCKKLRYALDAMGSPYRKKHESTFSEIISSAGRKTSHKDVDNTLRELQDMLGAIHDVDITVEFFEMHGAAKQLVASEKQKRKQEYGKFVNYMTAAQRSRQEAPSRK